MLAKIQRFNSLRNQMFVGFFAVMMIILTFVGYATFNSVSTLLKNNAEKHIQQTAVQANGRLEALLQQIDTLTMQVATNGYVQKLLLKDMDETPASFAERQALMPIVNDVMTYSNGIQSVELYTVGNQRLFPLDEASLEDRVDHVWINQANREKGKLVWIGTDPNDPTTVLAIRRISLMDRWFSHGGYVLVRINRAYFSFGNDLGVESGQESILLTDRGGNLIVSNKMNLPPDDLRKLQLASTQTVALQQRAYIVVKQNSSVTGWTLLILTPVSAITEGISVLRTAIILSGGIGTLLFLVMSFLLSIMITRPMFKLIRTMRSARLGVLKTNPDTSATFEIRELNRTYNQMVDDINRLIRLVYEKEIIQSRAELKALQAQINPHFLFNTLDALYWSLQDKDEEELAEIVVAMSELFRYLINSTDKDEWVTVGQELEHVERYLLIMKMRLGERLTWSIDASSDCIDTKLPKLLIQPLVENAIQYGVEKRIGPGSVKVTVRQSEQRERLMIIVEDDGTGMEEHKLREIVESLEGGQSLSPSVKGTGVGIANVQRRLQLVYEHSPVSLEGLKIRSEPGSGTSVSFEIPTVTE